MESAHHRITHQYHLSHMTKELWEQYCRDEIAFVTPLLLRHGITLADVQPHISGERFLMHAVTTTSGKKLILLGTTEDGSPVVIKATRDARGKAEILHERACRAILKKIDFAAEVFLSPKEVLFTEEAGATVAVYEFITQERTFLERPIEVQFDFALRAFKAQEGTHATTWGHRRLIREAFEIRTAQTYLDIFATFTANIRKELPEDTHIHETLTRAQNLLTQESRIIEQYADFLTHTDFVPHNIRIRDNEMYLLDHSSLTFGNKYEGWARFLNFMTLYNPPLTKALTEYVRQNRTQEESVSLRMMRTHRLGELIWYYTRTLKETEGNLYTLNRARVTFWHDVLCSVVKDEEVPLSIIETYTQVRDALRSDDEKRRQKGLH